MSYKKTLFIGLLLTLISVSPGGEFARSRDGTAIVGILANVFVL